MCIENKNFHLYPSILLTRLKCLHLFCHAFLSVHIYFAPLSGELQIEVKINEDTVSIPARSVDTVCHLGNK